MHQHSRNLRRNASRPQAGAADQRVRAGVTIIEVLFAIGVILIGLVGVVAVIPIAGRDAGEALRLDAANRMGSSTGDELEARGIGTLIGLGYQDIDPLADDYKTNEQRLTLEPTGTATSFALTGWRSLREYVEGPIFDEGGGVLYRYKALDSPGVAMRFPVANADYRAKGMASFCLDPDFYSKNATSLLDTDPTKRNGYQPARFPYYSEWYLPTGSPSAALPFTSSKYPHPRMYRVGVSNMADTGFTASMLADALTHADSSLMMHRPKDKALAPSQILSNLDSAGATAGARRGDGRYGWIATITPPLDGSRFYNMTVVVIESREAFAGLYTTQTISNADTNPQSERVFWVTNAVPLGSSVQATVYGSDAVDDSIRAGEWVMLSRQGYASGNTIPANAPAVHRWFRVQRVTARENGPFDDQSPYREASTTMTGVWRRTVVLEGPTWSFDGANNGSGLAPDQALADDTYMTVIDGAVSIKESTIELSP